MQVQDSDTQLLYGLFQGISTWAMDRGYKDIAGMKNLLKLAMVDTCSKRHADKSAFAAQMAVVTELGISLRNVQYTLKALDELPELSGDLVKIREVQKEITVVLLREQQTFDQILVEISYLIHAPHELQRRTLKTILLDMEQKGIIVSYDEKGKTVFRTAETHVNLYDATDLSARVSGLLTHIDAFNQTVGKPTFKTFSILPDQAQGLQQAVNEFLRGTGNAYEHDCRENMEITKPYYFYLGSSILNDTNSAKRISDAMLEVIRNRFQDPESVSLLRNHWYQLTPAKAQLVYHDVRNFIVRECETVSCDPGESDAEAFTLYFGLADRKLVSSAQEI